MTIRNKTYIDLLRFKKNSPLIFWLLTCYLIFIIIYFLIFLIFYADHSKAMALNELGDFLAGSFSPLAFIFLILGYMQNNKNLEQNSEALIQQAKALQLQSESLKLQIDELKIGNDALQMQATELQKSVEQQMKQVRISNEQLDYYRQKDISDEKKEAYQAKPILHLYRNSSGSDGDGFRLINTGGDASFIKCDRPLLDIPSLPKDKPIEFRTPYCVEFLVIEFKDKFGNIYKTQFNKGERGMGQYKSQDI